MPRTVGLVHLVILCYVCCLLLISTVTTVVAQICSIQRTCLNNQPCFPGQQGDYSISVNITPDKLPICTNCGDYTYEDPITLFSYSVNVCAASNLQCSSAIPGVGMVEDKHSVPPTCQVLGSSPSPLTFINPSNVMEGVTMTYTQGSRCGSTNNLRQVTFFYLCQNLIPPPATAISSAEASPSDEVCAYNITIMSKYACPTRTLIRPYEPSSSGISGGTVFCIILLVGIFVYLTVSAAYLYFVKHERGQNLIPHRQFWMEIPSLVRDGCRFTQYHIMQCISPTNNASSYQNIDAARAALPTHVPAMVDAQRGRTSSQQTSYQNDGFNNVLIAGVDDGFVEPASDSFETMRPPNTARNKTSPKKTPRPLQERPRQPSTERQLQPYE